jgi:hypothetical protein
METLLIWLLVFGGGYWVFLKAGKRAVSRQLSKQEEPVDPWADFKRLASEVRTRKAKELAEWQAEFQAIVQRTCTKHEYKDRSWNWYKCVHCEHEQEWKYSGGCACRSAWDKALTDATGTHVLLARSPYCQVHGRASYRKSPLPSTKYES